MSWWRASSVRASCSRAYPKALVAAVNADALGAGFGLVAACQLAIAVETARFGLPGVRLGIMPMTIMPAVFRGLPRTLGLERC